MISIPTIKRFPSYLRVLRHYRQLGYDWISATKIAEELGLTAVQVRKDMAGTGVEGKPKIGFEIDPLIAAIMHNLNWDTQTDAILVGAGNLGLALARYEGFASYGLRITAIFDSDESKCGKAVGDLLIMPINNISSYIQAHEVRIAVLTVPAAQAQHVAEELVACGIRAIWNFAPKDLKLPENVIVQRTDLATSFAVLSAKCRRMIDHGENSPVDLL